MCCHSFVEESVSVTCLSDRVNVATDKNDVFDRVVGLIKMFGDRSRISKVAIVGSGTALLPKAFLSPQCTVCRIFCIQ